MLKSVSVAVVALAAAFSSAAAYAQSDWNNVTGVGRPDTDPHWAAEAPDRMAPVDRRSPPALIERTPVGGVTEPEASGNPSGCVTIGCIATQGVR
jgi:hypothetical protein